jgi:hypothetical protein
MLRASVRLVFVLAAVCAVATIPAWAAEASPAPAAADSTPLPFLTAAQPDCPAAEPPAAPLPEFLSTGTGISNICTGCSSHNCFYQAEGTRCTVNGQLGRCVAHHYCPEVRELSCSCEAI